VTVDRPGPTHSFVITEILSTAKVSGVRSLLRVIFLAPLLLSAALGWGMASRLEEKMTVLMELETRLMMMGGEEDVEVSFEVRKALEMVLTREGMVEILPLDFAWVMRQ
jgi:hypothetical protein